MPTYRRLVASLFREGAPTSRFVVNATGHALAEQMAQAATPHRWRYALAITRGMPEYSRDSWQRQVPQRDARLRLDGSLELLLGITRQGQGEPISEPSTERSQPPSAWHMIEEWMADASTNTRYYYRHPAA